MLHFFLNLAVSIIGAGAELSFAKTPQGLDSGSRNNVTGHSACYSFQPRFES